MCCCGDIEGGLSKELYALRIFHTRCRQHEVLSILLPRLKVMRLFYS